MAGELAAILAVNYVSVVNDGPLARSVCRLSPWPIGWPTSFAKVTSDHPLVRAQWLVQPEKLLSIAGTFSSF